MIVDLDDYGTEHNRLDLLCELKRINPAFKCTLFAIPYRGWPIETPRDWCQLAMHGWKHSPAECEQWEEGDAKIYMNAWGGEYGFKAPYWQISDGCYAEIYRRGWWCADHPDNASRRPAGLRYYDYSEHADAWHGHIQNVCGNGLEERFDELADLVARADSFQFVSEVVKPWTP